jgi:hypothetical protein
MADNLDGGGSEIERVERDAGREQALLQLKALGWTMPPGFRLTRDEATCRDSGNPECPAVKNPS